MSQNQCINSFEFRREIKKLIETTKDGSVRKIVRGNRQQSKNLTYDNSQIWTVSVDKEYNRYKYDVDINHPYFNI